MSGRTAAQLRSASSRQALRSPLRSLRDVRGGLSGRVAARTAAGSLDGTAGDTDANRTTRGTIMHVTTTPISLELLLGPQLRAYRDAGYRVVTASSPGPEVAQLATWGIEHFPLHHATRSMAPHRDLLATRELHALFRRVRPDIVHTHNPKPGLYGRVAAAAAGVPVIVNTVHGLYAQPTDPWRRRAAVYAAELVGCWCGDAELVLNEEDMAVLEGLPVSDDRLVLLGSGIDLSRFDPSSVSPAQELEVRAGLGLAPDDVVICVVGRLVWEKGLREVFAAARAMREAGSRARWLVVGPADPSKADQVDEASIRAAELDGVVFAGYRSDVQQIYAASDLFVLASHREGFPFSAMEAAAMGLPVVATDIRGCRQVVEDGVTGLLVPVRDSAALTAAVSSLTGGDPSRREAMGRAALSKAAREFDDRRIIQTTLSVYDRLLKDKGLVA